MQKFLLLLRGVNVGGNNKISMAELKLALENLGYSNVISYINSGNIIFSSDNSLEELISSCRNLLESQFKLFVDFTLISAKDYLASIAQIPSWWNTDSASRHNALAFCPPATSEEFISAIPSISSEFEHCTHTAHLVFWSVVNENYNHSQWRKILEHPLYSKVTIRNANTTLKLAQLLQQK